MIKVYGVPGWGSTISELMLTLADIPYQFVDVSGFDHEGTSRDLLKNPESVVSGSDTGAVKITRL